MSKTIDTLKTEYRDLAFAHGQATNAGDHKAANRNHDKLVALVPKIRAFGSEGHAALLALLKDQDDAVVCWAATHVLPFDEKQATAVLDDLSKKRGPMGFNAKMVLQQWRKGQLILP